MARYVALLRAVNVGGTAKLPMAALREILEHAGYKNVRTLLASGNTLFEAPKTASAKLERHIEALLADKAGMRTDVSVRSAEEWAAVLDQNPFPEEAASAPSQLGLMVMKAGPDEPNLTAYLDAYAGPEKVIAGERCIYIYFPDGMGRTKLTISNKVGIGTVRNWNTALKIAELLSAN